MTFQSTVQFDQAGGVVGELATESPLRSASYILNSSGTANTIGNVFTHDADGVVQVGGTGAFAGVLVNPKSYALLGTSAGGALAPSLDLPDDTNGEILSMGSIYVSVTNISAGASGAIGDPVYYVNATGAIGLGTAASGQTQIPNAKLDLRDITAPGLAIITLTN